MLDEKEKILFPLLIIGVAVVYKMRDLRFLFLLIVRVFTLIVRFFFIWEQEIRRWRIG